MGGWNYHIVDSMGTEAPIGSFGTLANLWTDGAASKLDYNSRIQMSRNASGSRIFYSWTESDTTISGPKWNLYPDIKMKGYDVTLYKLTSRLNVSSGIMNADKQSYFHFTSSKAISTGTTLCEIPLTITHNSTANGGTDVNHYYLKGTVFSSSDFTINPNMSGGATSGCSALYIDEKINEVNSFNIIPNPSSGLVSLSFLLDKPQDINLNIFDYLGRLIEDKEVKGIQGSNEIDLDLSSYNSGLYLITIVTDSFTETKKIIKE